MRSLDVYTYEGDGIIEASEFYARTFYSSVNNNADTFEQIDITQAVNDALNNGQDFIGIRLSTTDADRFWIGGSIVGDPEPVLTIVTQ